MDYDADGNSSTSLAVAMVEANVGKQQQTSQGSKRKADDDVPEYTRDCSLNLLW